jgi:hypothetical protein
MANPTAYIFGNAIHAAFSALVSDLDGAGTTLKCALLLDTYPFNQDTHISYADILAYEASGAGYSAGGVALTSPVLSYATKVTSFDCDDPLWITVTVSTVRYAAIYDSTPSGNSNKKLLVLIDFGENKAASAGTFKIVLSAAGVFSITVA